MSERTITITVTDSNSDGDIVEETRASVTAALRSVKVDAANAAAALVNAAKHFGLAVGTLSEPVKP